MPGPSRRLGDVLVQHRQGHVAEQRREDRPLRGTGVGFPHDAVLGEDARLQERLHQGQDAFVPDPSPHPVHQGRMRDLVEAGFDVALHDPLVGAGGEDGAPRPPRHEPGASGGTRRSTGENPPRRSAPTPVSRMPGPPGRARSRSPGGDASPFPASGSSAPATGSGRKLRSFNSVRSSSRNTSTPTLGLDVVGGLPVHSGRACTLVAPHPIPAPPTGTPGSATRLNRSSNLR